MRSEVCLIDSRLLERGMMKLFIAILFSLFSFYSFGQEVNRYTYGDYDFLEIKTKFSTATFVLGFVNDGGIAKDQDGNYFLVDTLGNSINSIGFDDLDFNNVDNYFVVARNGKYGVINSKAKLIVPFLYKNIISTGWDMKGSHVFQNGLCMVKDSADKIGFVDTTGKVIIPIIYSEMYKLEWSEGGHVVGLNDFQGIVDTLGNIVIPIKYRRLTPLSYDHTIALDANNSVLLISKNGIVKKIPYTDFHNTYSPFGGFTNGLAGVQNALGLWGYIDTCGNEIIKCQYDAITDFSDGIARVCKNAETGSSSANWGYINTKGALITPIKYQDAEEFENGIAKVRMVDLKDSVLYYNFINIEGKEINTCRYISADRMKYGVARVRNYSWYLDYKLNRNPTPDHCTYEGRDVILDMEGKEIDIDKEYCLNGLWFSDDVIAVDSSFHQGFVNTKGKVIVPCFYTYVYEFNNGYAWVKKENDDHWYILKKKKR